MTDEQALEVILLVLQRATLNKIEAAGVSTAFDQIKAKVLPAKEPDVAG